MGECNLIGDFPLQREFIDEAADEMALLQRR